MTSARQFISSNITDTGPDPSLEYAVADGTCGHHSVLARSFTDKSVLKINFYLSDVHNHTYK